MTLASLDDCQIISLPKISDHRGNLTFTESVRHIPFEIKRVYSLYDVPGGGLEQAGHVHRWLLQVLIAMSCCFDMTVDDGTRKKTFHLCRSYSGLFIPRRIWRVIYNFSSNSICMALASDFYSEASYYREYADFIAAVNADKKAEAKGS